jgi:hypothetical protein
MTRYQLINPDTGEILWQWGKRKQTEQRLAVALIRKAWQLEDRRRGYKPRPAYKASRRLQQAQADAILAVALAMLVGGFLWAIVR